MQNEVVGLEIEKGLKLEIETETNRDTERRIAREREPYLRTPTRTIDNTD